VRFDVPTGQRYLRVSDCGVRYDVVAPPGTAATHAVGTGHVEVGRMIAVDVRPKAEVGRMIGADVRPSAGPAPDRMAVGRDRNRAGTTVGSCSLALYEG
jgi:hypothetical protein